MVFCCCVPRGDPFFVILITFFFFSSLSLCVFSVAQNESVDRDKGNFTVKDESGVISLDDLLSEKSSVQKYYSRHKKAPMEKIPESEGIPPCFIKECIQLSHLHVCSFLFLYLICRCARLLYPSNACATF